MTIKGKKIPKSVFPKNGISTLLLPVLIAIKGIEAVASKISLDLLESPLCLQPRRSSIRPIPEAINITVRSARISIRNSCLLRMKTLYAINIRTPIKNPKTAMIPPDPETFGAFDLFMSSQTNPNCFAFLIQKGINNKVIRKLDIIGIRRM